MPNFPPRPSINPIPDSPMPEFVPPMLCGETAQPFDDPNWLFEIKWDGYRAITSIDNGRVKIFSRNANLFNERFFSLLKPLSGLKHDLILDGEITALNEKGLPRFELLRQQKNAPLTYYIFDLLYLDRKNLMGLELWERKKILAEILEPAENLKLSESFEKNGREIYEQAKVIGLEGLIAKEQHSRYLAGQRSPFWKKIKILKRRTAVIAGFTGSRSGSGIGALVLGAYSSTGEFVHVGMSGSGIDYEEEKKLLSILNPIVTYYSPFVKTPATAMPVTWVKPLYVCEIEYMEQTESGVMRQPIFLGLREDKPAKEIKTEE